MTTRRQFLTASAATLAGAALAPVAPAPAIEPIVRNGKPHIRLSLAAYSYRKYLDLKKPAMPPMTLEDFAEVAASLDLDAIEPTEYYFKDKAPEYMAHLKGKCTRLGLDISGTAVGNKFCLRDPDKLRQEINLVKTWTENTARLGGKTIRIFAGSLEKGDSEEEARKRCIASIQECCDHGAKFGVILALENHGGIVSTAEQMLSIIKEIKHDWFGVNLDTGNFHTADPYGDIARIAPYAVVVQVKTEIHRAGEKKKEDADLKRLVDILRAVNYRGYVELEYEAAEDPKIGVPKAIAALKKLV